jgi:hypothetical protein
MFQRLRSHLTYANVLVTLLAFVVLGGGSALASVIITSNSQVAKRTISGHNPPSGKHSNIIAKSVNGPDVQNLQFQRLALKNGWEADCFGGGVPAIARSVEGIVYFRGDMCQDSDTSSSNNAFKVPPGFQPTKFERIAVVDKVVNGETGGIQVNPGGQVYVRIPDRSPVADRFISLAGASYTLPF